MRILPGALCLALLLADAAQAAVETVYVRPQPATPLLATPAADAIVLRRLTAGDALTVLGRQAGFVDAQAADGVRGWLREADVTATAPPAARVIQLEQEATRLRTELATAQSELRNAQGRLRQAEQAASAARSAGADEAATLESENADLRMLLAEAAAERDRLRSRVGELEMAQEAARLLAARQPADTRDDASRFSRTELLAGIAAALGLALFGAWVGTSRAHRRLRQRYHGLEL